ncbi:FAD binding domain-containing protein [Solirubrobacter soli]|uniref:FAD binding domain-containing protein n=1 Tax=Solirubrobacter soli TaxID=363832 RepID=UPI0004245721|nr:FAD binding domain-containing protein [Solirubrobacter soli]
MKVHVPESVDEAVGLLGAGVLCAGGTSVIPHVGPTTSLVSLRRVGLAGITVQDRTVRIGAATTLARIGREVEFLHDAIESIASPTIRNLATIGGNLFARQPHGDLAVCLLALDARVSIIDADGARDVGVLDATGLVTAISFEIPERWYYTKAMRRRQNSASIVTVASDGVRIALGGVAPRPVRATAAEEALAQGDIEKAAELSVEAADPFDDAYASAWYRRRVLPVHVRRALTNAI